MGYTPGQRPWSQLNSNWQGIVDAFADLPNSAGSPYQFGVPNVQLGDLAWVKNGAPGLYQCVDPTLGAAVWTLIGGGGGAGQDRFAPKYLVGNVLAGDSAVAYSAGGFTYIPDPGDGSGIAAALALAAVPGGAGDISLRPGVYDLRAGSVAVPLVVPAGSRVVGAGRVLTTIISKTAIGASQEVFILGAGCQLSDLAVQSPAPLQDSAGAGTSKALITSTAAACIVRDCIVTLSGTVRTQPWGIWDPTGTIQILDCLFEGSDMDNGNPTGPSIAMVIGPDRVATPNSWVAPTFSSFRIKGCQHVSANGTGFNQAVFVYNTLGGHLSECDFDGMARPQFGVITSDFAGAPITTPGFAMTVEDTRITVLGTEQEGDAAYQGVALFNVIDGYNIGGFEWTALRVAFLSGGVTVDRKAYVVAAATAGQGPTRIEGGVIKSAFALGHTVGIQLEASTAGSLVTDINITGPVVKNPETRTSVGRGIALDTVGGAIDAVCIANGNARNTTAGQIGIDIGVGAVNTIVTGNNLVPNGGTALANAGTGTAALNNILV